MRREKKGGSLIWVAVFWIFCLAVFVGTAAETGAESAAKEVERTPGPRMIRAVEALANDAGGRILLLLTVLSVVDPDGSKDIW